MSNALLQKLRERAVHCPALFAAMKMYDAGDAPLDVVLAWVALDLSERVERSTSLHVEALQSSAASAYSAVKGP